jgi:protein-L-isoaspartate O-methyltransferase
MVDNTALLDVYTVTWAGKATPVTLYINMHRGGRLLAPVGFTGAR